jgi:hypothetical protein
MPISKKKSTFTTGVALGGFIGGFVFSAFLFSGFLTPVLGGKFNLQFDAATTITIVLTALSIMLTALGIIIAVIGLFGFNILRSAAVNAAAEHASEQLGEDSKLRALVEAHVNDVIAMSQSGSRSSNEFPNPESEYGE